MKDPEALILLGGAVTGVLLSPIGPWPQARSPYALPIAILATAALAILTSHRRALRHRLATFSDREPLQPAVQFDLLFTDAGLDRDAFLGHWDECARLLRIPATLLRASDRFKVELAATGFFDGLGHPLEDLEQYALLQAHAPESRSELDRIETLGQLVAWLTRESCATQRLRESRRTRGHAEGGPGTAGSAS